MDIFLLIFCVDCSTRQTVFGMLSVKLYIGSTFSWFQLYCTTVLQLATCCVTCNNTN